MQSSPLLLEEPIRMSSILEPSKPSFFPAMTKIVGTLGPKSRSVDVISRCLEAGMSVARFDFSWGDPEYHQETLEYLRAAIKSTKKLCAVMLDTVGPELQVVNKTERSISLQADTLVVLTPDQNKEASPNLLPVNFSGLAKAVKKGDTIFIGQYLFTGSETTSVWLEVSEVDGEDVTCVIKNSATLPGSLYTLHVSQIHIDLPTLTDKDKEVISTWGVQNNIDFLSLSYTRHAEDVRHAREFLSKLGDLKQTQIFAKIENIEGLTHFDEILREADGIILSRGNLGIDLPPEKVFLFQKAAIYKCNMAGKPAVVTRVVDTMTDNLRPTRAEATDVANAVLDGSDAIVLGAETLRGLYPVETISIVGKICAEVKLVAPSLMPKLGKAGSLQSRIAIVHSLAHTESWAIDLSWDIIARFGKQEAMPREFFTDFVKVAQDEGRHFTLLAARLEELGSYYGALPAHDGLWDSATATSKDLLSRLVVEHCVHEARGLDVLPTTISRFRNGGDNTTADLLERVVYPEEITHCATGVKWFKYLCQRFRKPISDQEEQEICAVESGTTKEENEVIPKFHAIVRTYFRGPLKPPFNEEARKAAGFGPEWYEPLAVKRSIHSNEHIF